MKTSRVIGSFDLNGKYFTVHWDGEDFDLTLSDHTKKYSSKNATNVDKLFWDVDSVEDVGSGINAFRVGIEAINIIVSYVKKHGIKKFRFIASTDRKARLYGRIARKIASELRYDWTVIGSKFFFWSKD